MKNMHFAKRHSKSSPNLIKTIKIFAYVKNILYLYISATDYLLL